MILRPLPAFVMCLGALMQYHPPLVAAEAGQRLALQLAAGGIEEPCFAMAATDRLEFSFESDVPLDFNLHYHEGDEVHFPVNLSQVAREEGQYIAPRARRYCLMWTNRSSGPAGLSYSYRVSPTATD